MDSFWSNVKKVFLKCVRKNKYILFGLFNIQELKFGKVISTLRYSSVYYRQGRWVGMGFDMNGYYNSLSSSGKEQVWWMNKRLMMLTNYIKQLNDWELLVQEKGCSMFIHRSHSFIMSVDYRHVVLHYTAGYYHAFDWLGVYRALLANYRFSDYLKTFIYIMEEIDLLISDGIPDKTIRYDVMSFMDNHVGSNIYRYMVKDINLITIYDELGEDATIRYLKG